MQTKLNRPPSLLGGPVNLKFNEMKKKNPAEQGWGVGWTEGGGGGEEVGVRNWSRLGTESPFPK